MGIPEVEREITRAKQGLALKEVDNRWVSRGLEVGSQFTAKAAELRQEGRPDHAMVFIHLGSRIPFEISSRAASGLLTEPTVGGGVGTGDTFVNISLQSDESDAVFRFATDVEDLDDIGDIHLGEEGVTITVDVFDGVSLEQTYRKVGAKRLLTNSCLEIKTPHKRI